MNRQRGFALLIVLWTMALLALLVGQFTAAGRTEARVAGNIRLNAVVEAAADGAMHEAILRMIQGSWAPDGRRHIVRVGDTAVELQARDQAWKVNPNLASQPILQALMTNLGIEPGRATSLAEAIVAWRAGAANPPQGAPQGLPRSASRRPASRLFETLDELRLVPGITPALMARLEPALSVYTEADLMESGDSIPPGLGDPSRAPADGWRLGSSGRVMLAMIEATAVGAHGGRFTRRAVVRLRAEPSLDQVPFQILTWEAPSS
jgi:general secretion pathway protein K